MCRDKHIDQWNSKKNLEIKPRIWIGKFQQRCKGNGEKKDSLSTKDTRTIWNLHAKKLTWIHIKVKPKSIKLIEKIFEKSLVKQKFLRHDTKNISKEKEKKNR